MIDQANMIERLCSQQEILQRRMATMEVRSSDMVWIVGQIGNAALFARNLTSQSSGSQLRDVFAEFHHGEGARDV